MNTKSISATSVEELSTLIEKVQLNEFHPNLAISFSDPTFDIEGTIDLLNQKSIQFIGCTTSGEICDSKMNEGTFTLLLIELPQEHFHIAHFSGSGNNYFDPAEKIAQLGKEKFQNPAFIVYSGGIGIDGESIVNGIKGQFDKNIPIHGGQGADHFRYQSVNTFTHNGNHNNGISALILDGDKIRVDGNTYSGWNDLGKMHTITKSEGNIIYEIDDKPALDLFNNYFPSIEYKNQDGSDKLFTIPGIYPLKIYRDQDVEILRSGMIYDFENKALVLAGGVKQGDNFKFCPTPSFDVVETTVQQFTKLSENIGEVDAIIINTCAGRHFAFGPMFEDEIEGLYKIWNKPTVGYMAYGEIGKIGTESNYDFHNVSCSLVTLTEI